MTAQPASAASPAPPEESGRRGFALPSAYTILFALIVLTAIATWFIPAGAYELDENGQPIPGSYAEVEANPQRIVVDSLMAPINGLYGIEDEARSASGTRASSSGPSTWRSSSSSLGASWV
jgi:uncharacterized ion transporter superfamily protein YfcC